MGTKGMPMLPPRWLDCPRMGDMILDIFIPFKTPLDSKFDHSIPSEKIFHVDDVFETAQPYKLGLIVDLTKSKRFYQRREITDVNCKFIKIECKGNEETPTPEQVNLFIKVVNQFLDNNPGELKVDARPPGIYKADYLEDLFERYGVKEDCPGAPTLPDWCLEDGTIDSRKRAHPNDLDCPDNLHTRGKSTRGDDAAANNAVSITDLPTRSFPPAPRGSPKLMEGVHRVTTLDQDSPEAHEARALADRLLKAGGCVYGSGGQLIYADGQSSDSETESTEPSKPEETSKRIKHPLRFRGSQPVSISQRNTAFLVNEEYCVTYKADGTRYLILVAGPERVYLIDRGNFVYKPQVLHFPTVSWVKEAEKSGRGQTNATDFLTSTSGHLFNTLLDGEMVMCRDPSKPASSSSSSVSDNTATTGTVRFLIYDIVTLNNRPVGRSPFFERYTVIDRQIIWPRNTGGHLGLVDFGQQSFSIRRKPFRPFNQTEELLRSEFVQRLDHETDGLILQPCGPEDFYVLGTCPQTLKWKPPHLNTIDFRCKIVYESKVGEIPGYVGQLFLGGLNVPSAKLAHAGPKDKHLDGKIVECAVASGVGWRVLRIRTDKTEPNYHKSGVAILESIMLPVTAQNLLMCVRQRGLKMKPQLPSGTASK